MIQITTKTVKPFLLHSQQSFWNHIHDTKLPAINWLITLHFFHVNGAFFPLHCLTVGSTLTFVSLQIVAVYIYTVSGKKTPLCCC